MKEKLIVILFVAYGINFLTGAGIKISAKLWPGLVPKPLMKLERICYWLMCIMLLMFFGIWMLNLY